MTEPRTNEAILARRMVAGCVIAATVTLVLSASPSWTAPADTSAATSRTTAAPAGTDTAAARPAGDEGPRRLPVNVQIEGVSDDLRSNVKGFLGIAREDKPLTEAQVRTLHGRADRQIAQALEPFGYYRPAVEATLEEQGGRWLARYVIDPGPAIRIDTVDVRIEGDGARDPAFIRAMGTLPLRKGDVLVHQNYELAKAALVNAALRTGYLDAHYTANAIRVDLQRYQAAVVLHYQTGWQHLFGELVFHQDVLNPGILEGYANFKRGTPVDYAKLTELESNLASSNQFSRVEVRPRVDLERNREVPIHAELEPARRTRFTAGAGIGSDAGPFGNLGVEFRRLNRRGHRARIETTIGQIEQSGTAQYQIPWPYPRTDVLTLAAAHGREKTQTTNELTTAGSTTITRAFGNWTEGYSLAYRIQEYEVGIDRGTERFLAPRGSWTYTMRNQPLDPRLGRRILFDTEGAWKGVVSTRSYVRGLAQASWLQAFRGVRNRIILRGDLGGLWTNAFRQLPGSIRFFAGGSNSVRGYGYNSLGAKDSLGNVIGGSLLMVGSAEYEYRFLPRWGAAVFYDIGNAVLSSSDPLESGAGVGARWVSPVGMVRVDLAFPLSERGRRMMIHFGIGTGL